MNLWACKQYLLQLYFCSVVLRWFILHQVSNKLKITDKVYELVKEVMFKVMKYCDEVGCYSTLVFVTQTRLLKTNMPFYYNRKSLIEIRLLFFCIHCILSCWSPPGPHFNIKIVFPGMWVSIIKIRPLWDHLIFIMGIPVLVRQHLYIEVVPASG